MTAKPAAALPRIEVVIESRRWAAWPEAEAIVRKAVRAAARATSSERTEVAILLTHDSAMRKLNRQWRGFDKPTNVLSFPAGEIPVGKGSGDTSARNALRFVGDIVIACETSAREARAEGKPMHHHLSHLAVHGYLHLVGYDHEVDAEADAMEQLERRILANLRVPDPYALQVEG